MNVPWLAPNATYTSMALSVEKDYGAIVKVSLRDRLWNRIDYQPHEKQMAAHRAIAAGARFICDVWGKRTGKTIRKAVSLLEMLAWGPQGKLPKNLCRITGPTFNLTDPIFEYLWRWIVDKRVLGAEPVYKRSDMRFIEMPWHSRVECKTTDNPTNLQGRGITYTACDEHGDDDPDVLAQYIIPTTYDVSGVVDLGGTPKGWNNHLRETYEDYRERMEAGDSKYYASHATSYDNPYIKKEEVDEYLRYCQRMGLMDVYRQEVLAEFVSLAGAVYPNFQSTRGSVSWHVSDNLHPLPDVPLSCGFDWGFNNPFAAIFAQVSGDRLLVLDELYMRGLTDDECVQAVLRKKEELGMPIKIGYGDPSAPETIKTFRDYGISMYMQSGSGKVRLNDVGEGIKVVRSLFGREDKPGIIIHSRCVNLIRELAGLVYSKRGEKEKPVKENDHAPDALRYLAMGAVGIRAPEFFVWTSSR